MSTPLESRKVYIEDILPKFCLSCKDWSLPVPQGSEPEPLCTYREEMWLPVSEFACPKVREQMAKRLQFACRYCGRLCVSFDEDKIENVLFKCNSRCPMFTDTKS